MSKKWSRGRRNGKKRGVGVDRRKKGPKQRGCFKYNNNPNNRASCSKAEVNYQNKAIIGKRKFS